MTYIEYPATQAVGWNTFNELRHYVVKRGWLPPDFVDAIDVVGGDPHAIANYLQILVLQDAVVELRVRSAEDERAERFAQVATADFNTGPLQASLGFLRKIMDQVLPTD